MSKEFRQNKFEMSERVQGARVSYEAFRNDNLKAAYRIGDRDMGFGGEGEIQYEAKFALADLMFDLTKKLPQENLPKAVLLRSGYTGGNVVVQAGDISVDFTPSPLSEYFIPSSYERYRVHPSLGEEFIPTSDEFIGLDQVKQRQHGEVFFKTNIIPAKPFLSSSQRAERIQEMGQINSNEIDILLKAYGEVFTTGETNGILEGFRQKMEMVRSKREEAIDEAIMLNAPIIKRRLENLIRSVGDLARLPNSIPVTDKYEEEKRPEDRDKVILLVKEKRLVVVPVKKIQIFGRNVLRRPDFTRTRDANERELVRYASYAGEHILLGFLPKEIEHYVRYGET